MPVQRRLLVLSAALLVGLVLPGLAQAAPGSLSISQVYGGGGNSGATYKNDFIEVFNRGSSAMSLNGYSVQYASATGASWQVTPLTDVVLQPGRHYLVQEAAGAGGTLDLPAPDATGTINMSGTTGKVALVSSTTALSCGTSCATNASVLDFVGFGTATDFEGTGAAPAPSNTTADLRAANGCTDTDQNATDFSAGAPAPRNTATAATPCGPPPADATPTVTCPGAVRVSQGQAASVPVSARDADDRVTSIQASVSPTTASITRGPVTGAAAPGDTASTTIAVGADTAPGSYTVSITATNDDTANPQSATCSFTVDVARVRTIGEVQGAVSDSADGLAHRSPFAPASGGGAGTDTVRVRGVVTERTLARTSSGARQNGFFLQNTLSARDSDPTTSDGVFVFMGSATTLTGGYAPQVGGEVVLDAKVSEFFNLTELTSASLVEKVRGGVDIATETPAFDADPPADLAAAGRYWERREGMQARIPAGSSVTEGRNVFSSTADAEVWLINPTNPLATRADPFARRVFRDPHPLDNQPDRLFDDGNGQRIVLGSLGVKATTNDASALLNPEHVFDSTQRATTGGVYFSFSKYQIQVAEQPTFVSTTKPDENAPPTAPVRPEELSIANTNVENLYDFRDDPTDDCDFTGNIGCPGVSPPFDYVPASDAEYQQRLGLLAQQVREDLFSPEIVLVAEAEDQDVCSVSGAALDCGAALNNPDGRPDTLQELALRIAAQGGPAYQAVADRDGADARGIISGFLYRTDRVQMPDPAADDPVLGPTPTVAYRGAPATYNGQSSNPKALNAALPGDVDKSTGVDGANVFTRAPQVGRFRVWRDGVGTGTSFDLYAVANHFSSGPQTRVGQRREQAAYNAAIAKALDATEAGKRTLVGGDLNVFPRPDDPFAPGEPNAGSDQLAPLYGQGLENLFDTELADNPAAAYSYVFQGQAQTLDQQFVTPAVKALLRQTRTAHVNADWPADFDGDGARGLSDHDPLVTRLRFPSVAGGGSGSTGGGAGSASGGGAPSGSQPGAPRPSEPARGGFGQDRGRRLRLRLGTPHVDRRGRVVVTIVNLYPFPIAARLVLQQSGRGTTTLARRAARLAPGRRTTVRLVLTRRARVRLGGRPRGVSLTLMGRDPLGASRTVRRTVRRTSRLALRR